MPETLPTNPTKAAGVAAGACDEISIDPLAVAQAVAALPDEDIVDRMAEVFKALADPTRLQILLALTSGELCVCDLSSVIGLSQSAVSHQLRLLRQLRMVRSRREGKIVRYRLDDDHVLSLCAQTREHLSEEHR